jgi:hypothetical protein
MGCLRYIKRAVLGRPNGLYQVDEKGFQNNECAVPGRYKNGSLTKYIVLGRSNGWDAVEKENSLQCTVHLTPFRGSHG